MTTDLSTEDQIRVRVKELVEFTDGVVDIIHPPGDTDEGKRKNKGMHDLSRAALAAKLCKLVIDQCGVD
jgi:hypothetical protein